MSDDLQNLKNAIWRHYPSAIDTEESMAVALADMRHIADSMRLDWNVIMNQADAIYRHERENA